MINFPAPVLNISVILLGVHFVSLLLYKTNYHWSTIICAAASLLVPLVILIVRWKLNRFLAGAQRAAREQREIVRKSQMDLTGSVDDDGPSGEPPPKLRGLGGAFRRGSRQGF